MNSTLWPATMRHTLESIDLLLLISGAGVLTVWGASLLRSGRWHRPLPLRDVPLAPSPVSLLLVLGLYLTLTSAAGSLAVAPRDPRAALERPGTSDWHRVSLAINLAKLLACAPIPFMLAAARGCGCPPATDPAPRFVRLPGAARASVAIGGGVLAIHLLTTTQAFLARWVWTTWAPDSPPPVHDVLDALTNGAWGWVGAVQLYAIAVGAAPVAEELFFRGLLCAVLERFVGTWGAIACSALLFGLVHVPQWTDVLPLITMGMALGYLRHRHSLGVCIAVHALFNARTMIFATLAPEMLRV